MFMVGQGSPAARVDEDGRGRGRAVEVSTSRPHPRARPDRAARRGCAPGRSTGRPGTPRRSAGGAGRRSSSAQASRDGRAATNRIPGLPSAWSAAVCSATDPARARGRWTARGSARRPWRHSFGSPGEGLPAVGPGPQVRLVEDRERRPLALVAARRRRDRLELAGATGQVQPAPTVVDPEPGGDPSIVGSDHLQDEAVDGAVGLLLGEGGDLNERVARRERARRTRPGRASPPAAISQYPWNPGGRPGGRRAGRARRGSRSVRRSGRDRARRIGRTGQGGHHPASDVEAGVHDALPRRLRAEARTSSASSDRAGLRFLERDLQPGERCRGQPERRLHLGERSRRRVGEQDPDVPGDDDRRDVGPPPQPADGALPQVGPEGRLGGRRCPQGPVRGLLAAHGVGRTLDGRSAGRRPR